MFVVFAHVLHGDVHDIHVLFKNSSYKPSPQSVTHLFVELKKKCVCSHERHFVVESTHVLQGDVHASQILLMPINWDGQFEMQLLPWYKK